MFQCASKKAASLDHRIAYGEIPKEAEADNQTPVRNWPRTRSYFVYEVRKDCGRKHTGQQAKKPADLSFKFSRMDHKNYEGGNTQ